MKWGNLTIYTILCAGNPASAATQPHSLPTALLSPPQVEATTLAPGTISLMTNCVKHWAAQGYALVMPSLNRNKQNENLLN